MRLHSSIGFVFVGLAACGPAPDAVTPPAGTATVAPAIPSAEPTATSSATAPVEPAELPIPAAPPGADPEKVAIVGAICALAVGPVTETPGTRRVGCRSHPPFLEAASKPDGKIAYDVDPLALCSIEELYRGSFTKAGAKQVLLAFSQCQVPGEEWDAANPGSAVVVEEAGSRWKVVAYEPDINVDRCKAYKRADDRDAVVCQDSFGASESGGLRWFFSFDPGKEQGSRTSQFGKVFFDDFHVPCDGYVPEFLEYGMIRVEVAGYSIEDVNRDGKVDVVARVKRSRVAPGKGFQAKIAAGCKARKPEDGPLPPASVLPKATESTLEFHGDGSGFAPSPATEKLLAKWRAESPATWMNMR